MTGSASIYGVLLYEPRAVRPGLRIANWVLSDLQAMVNGRFPSGLIPEGFPDDERFVIDVRPYGPRCRVPSVLGDLDLVYRQMAPRGIAVSFFNTACPGPDGDYRRLAELLPGFPAIRSSAWVVTTSLREPIPRAFMDRIDERRPGEAAAEADGGAVEADCSTCVVPMGDSIVVRAKVEALRCIIGRLKRLRRAEMAGREASYPGRSRAAWPAVGAGVRIAGRR